MGVLFEIICIICLKRWLDATTVHEYFYFDIIYFDIVLVHNNKKLKIWISKKNSETHEVAHENLVCYLFYI